MQPKSLDQKLAAIHAAPSGSKEFIIADAKDADMAFGIGAPGRSPEMHAGEVRMRTLGEYREQIRQIVQQGLVDIMLMSASTNDVLTVRERLFDTSHVTPAARANDTSDICVVRGNAYSAEASRAFRTATLDHIQCGHSDCAPEERVRGANLGLYSITFNNRLDEDLASLEEYKRFRIEAELLRDAVLKTRGLLSPKIGGPSVFPPQPPGVSSEGAYRPLDWKVSEGPDRYRRGLYTFSKRTAPYAMFLTFDAP
ncbi:MAG: DUF1553 domain-containing protein, partial [Planctomycetes bacterium]|nr:DUF1553 domain-containing protein [Planctomycetota bacterium]